LRDESHPAADSGVRFVDRGIRQLRSIGPVEVFAVEHSG
jgi:hypothetical protein